MTSRRRLAGYGLGLVSMFLASQSFADAPGSSLRPLARPAAMVEIDEAAATAVETIAVLPASVQPVQTTDSGVRGPESAEVRPRARAGVFTTRQEPADSAIEVSRQVTRIHYGAELRPTARPAHPLDGFEVLLASASSAERGETAYPKPRPAVFRKLFPKREGSYSKTGSVCGVNAIKGTPQKSFGNPGRGCGVADPVRVTEVSGVKLSQPATIDCTTAKALNSWVENGIKPAFGRKGGGVSQVKVAAHYVCRNRNHRAGGKLSEHAKGHAVDISAIRLNDGTEVTVLNGWRSKTWSQAMRKVHRSACGPFGTVLGPNADRYHQDHFHVDTARYRSGSYCR